MIRDLAKFLIVLGLVCLVAGGGVAALYAVFKADIERRDQAARDEAVRAVLPDGAAADLEKPLALNPATGDAVFAAAQDGRTVAYVASAGAQGYSSVVRVMVGVRADDLAVIRVAVLSQQETPGLGAHVAERVSNFTLWEKIFGPSERGKTEELVNPFLDRFRGQKDTEIRDIQGITAATITSNATKAAVGVAIGEIRKAIERK
jgi:RnfABCDGE-type electron transport complex G subunit